MIKFCTQKLWRFVSEVVVLNSFEAITRWRN